MKKKYKGKAVWLSNEAVERLRGFAVQKYSNLGDRMTFNCMVLEVLDELDQYQKYRL
jgi:hypothetical protein